MVSAIQTVPSAYIASQLVGLAAVSQPANQATSQAVLPSTTVSLGTTTSAPINYPASALIDTGSSSGSVSATDNQSDSTQASVVATDTNQNAASIQLAADLEARTIAENLAVLDKLLADSLARQLLVNTKADAAALAATTATDASQASEAERLATSRRIEIARQATAANNARILDELLAARANHSNTENVVNAGQNAVVRSDSSTNLPSDTTLQQPITNESSAATNATPAATANVVAASNTTTNSLSNTSEVTNSIVGGNPTFNSVVQAVTSVAQNPASVASSSALSPPVTATPITVEEAVAAIAISLITDLSQSVATTDILNAFKTDSAITLSSPTPQPEPVTNASAPAVSTTPATTTNVVAASNTTTNSVSNTAEVANSPVVNPVSNPVVDSAVQAIATVGQDPAYANLVSGNYTSIAASSAQSPSITTTPIELEEVKPVIAIPAITTLSQLGAQLGRDGNAASGFRQRVAISNTPVRQARPTI